MAKASVHVPPGVASFFLFLISLALVLGAGGTCTDAFAICSWVWYCFCGDWGCSKLGKNMCVCCKAHKDRSKITSAFYVHDNSYLVLQKYELTASSNACCKMGMCSSFLHMPTKSHKILRHTLPDSGKDIGSLVKDSLAAACSQCTF